MITGALTIVAFAICGCSAGIFTRPQHPVTSKGALPEKFSKEWSDWYPWSSCSQECNGKRLRLRESIGGLIHLTDYEEQSCNLAGDTIKFP